MLRVSERIRDLRQAVHRRRRCRRSIGRPVKTISVRLTRAAPRQGSTELPASEHRCSHGLVRPPKPAHLPDQAKSRRDRSSGPVGASKNVGWWSAQSGSVLYTFLRGFLRGLQLWTLAGSMKGDGAGCDRDNGLALLIDEAAVVRGNWWLLKWLELVLRDLRRRGRLSYPSQSNQAALRSSADIALRAASRFRPCRPTKLQWMQSRSWSKSSTSTTTRLTVLSPKSWGRWR